MFSKSFFLLLSLSTNQILAAPALTDLLEFDPPLLTLGTNGSGKFKCRPKLPPSKPVHKYIFNAPGFSFSNCDLEFNDLDYQTYKEVEIFALPNFSKKTAEQKISIGYAESCSTDNYEYKASYNYRPGGTCLSTGDPHYSTFTGQAYSYQGSGSYYMVKDANLQIQTRLFSCGKGKNLHKVTCNDGIAISYGSSAVTLQVAKTHLTSSKLSDAVNENEILVSQTGKDKTSYDVKLGDGSKITVKSNTYTKDKSYLDITIKLSGGSYENVGGLCNYLPGGKQVHYVLPNGSVTKKSEEFANAWKAPANEDMFSGNWKPIAPYQDKPQKTCNIKPTLCTTSQASTSTTTTTSYVSSESTTVTSSSTVSETTSYVSTQTTPYISTTATTTAESTSTSYSSSATTSSYSSESTTSSVVNESSSIFSSSTTASEYTSTSSVVNESTSKSSSTEPYTSSVPETTSEPYTSSVPEATSQPYTTSVDATTTNPYTSSVVATTSSKAPEYSSSQVLSSTETKPYVTETTPQTASYPTTYTKITSCPVITEYPAYTYKPVPTESTEDYSEEKEEYVPADYNIAKEQCEKIIKVDALSSMYDPSFYINACALDYSQSGVFNFVENARQSYLTNCRLDLEYLEQDPEPAQRKVAKELKASYGLGLENECTNKCSGRGTCTPNGCACDAGYSGAGCAIDVSYVAANSSIYNEDGTQYKPQFQKFTESAPPASSASKISVLGLTFVFGFLALI
ncbi:hypothetical protein HDU92_001115 [Lobulomyces angularis]|nr:hypothetical protein HDU92_001115 [Lobulomyces angularis]